MKKILLISSILAGTAAVSSASAMNLDDLFFKPMAKETIAEIGLTNQEESYRDSDGGSVSKNTKMQNLDIHHGLTEKFSLGLSLSHQEEKTNYNALSSSTKSDGFANPKIALDYRIAEQDSQGFFTDLRVSYAPDTLTAKIATSSRDGNVASGGDEYGLGISHGKTMGQFAYKADFDLTYLDNVETKNVSTSAKSSENGRANFELGLTGQYKVNDMFSVDAKIAKEFMGSYSDSDGTITQGGDELKLATALNFSTNPDKHLVKLSYQYSEIGDTEDGSNTALTSNATSHKMAVSFAYKF